MIYLLVYDDFESSTKYIFSSKNKNIVVKRLNKIIKKNKIFDKIHKRLIKEFDLFRKELKEPTKNLDISSLPRLPLIWKNDKWNNYYVLENEDKLREFYIRLQNYREKLVKELATIYSVSEKEINDYEFTLPAEYYSIKEIESD